MTELSLRPSARIVDLIGKELIIDHYAAVVELVKNSYDADAEWCKIFFNKIDGDSLEIIVSDNGHGMTESDILEKWIVPGTSDKLKRNNGFSPNGRMMLGSKGLGRFSVGMLGDIVTLDTFSLKENIILKIDLREFRKVKYLDEVKFGLEKLPNSKNQSGTKISVLSEGGSSNFWFEEGINNLINELRKLIIGTNTSRQSFKVYIGWNGDADGVCFDFLSKESIGGYYMIKSFDPSNYYFYRLYGTIYNNGNVELTYENKRKGTKSKDISNIQIPKNLLEINCGNINIDIRVFDRDNEQLDLIGKDFFRDGLTGELWKRSDVKEILDSSIGIHIVRGFFSIRPYGSIDRLELDTRRVQDPSFQLGYNQLSGVIEVEDDNISGLFEKSARDGLQKNINFKKFKYLIISAIQILENYRYEYRVSEGISRSNKFKNNIFMTNQQIEFGKLRQTIKSTFETTKLNPIEGKKLEDEIKKQIDDIEIQSNEKQKYFKETISLYQGQATLGKMITIILHEVRGSFGLLKSNVIYIIEVLKSQTKDFKNIIERSERMKDHILRLAFFMKKIEPLGRVKDSKKKINLNKYIDDTIEIFDDLSKKSGITFIVDIPESVNIVIFEQAFLSVLVNIIDNSLYWLTQSNTNPAIINIYANESPGKDYLYLFIEDNGPGFYEEDLRSGIIFEPRFTRKSNGTGMGLTIAGEMCEKINAKLSISNKKEGGSRSKLSFKLSNSNAND